MDRMDKGSNLMEAKNTFSLTPGMVRRLMRRLFSRTKLEKSRWMVPGTDIYGGRTGPEGLILVCENDWKDGCGKIRLSICDGATDQCIVQYYDPDTLARDFEMEARRREGKG